MSPTVRRDTASSGVVVGGMYAHPVSTRFTHTNLMTGRFTLWVPNMICMIVKHSSRPRGWTMVGNAVAQK